jgi:HAD superfamily phosphoserine phosphatase-like hydrolase
VELDDNTRVLAIFDFDKTLISQDSFRIFSLHAATTHRQRLLMWLLAILCKFRMIGNEDYKAAVLRRVWSYRPTREQRDVLATFLGRMRPLENGAVVRRLQRHLASNDRVAVFSASPEFYLRPFVSVWSGKIEVIATSVRQEGIDLVVENMYGSTKASAANSLIEQYRPVRICVYTDHVSDLPLVRLAHEVCLVRPSRRLLRTIRKLQIPFEVIDT